MSRTPEIDGMVIETGPWDTNPLARDPKAPQGSSELSQSDKTRLSTTNAVRVLVGPILSEPYKGPNDWSPSEAV